nr:aminodeoxychorismate synthase component I [Kibdelosporangium sp. MJ126-NF4]CEL20118.1 Para-aminobenzoate synthase, amidotransferase component / Para-aminobenzoate synthase, aminase component [Kibdelosporangium sp. MJ126-NF4]CTQ97342.1 Para-aminobenzoate synthase, amidotransferase component (EC 2.6.1.85) / Para-aminobenzoate synthase, aminase component (EC 2.6.1.85) [Kibdelosporangium sp. MJ126-NF4]
MRTLLIDNHDSYTYNLFQLIAEVNGEEPVVIPNNPAAGVPVDLDAFDNIVISPGPGHPARPADFGICASVIERTTIPLLGVCLGHQGIATTSGADVGAAPRARHGHLTTVTHDGSDLFAGLPETFTAVRYHSLRVPEPLPPGLVATAWAEDGVVMGLRHRGRPLWGVQFHPESIASEYGRELLANFRDITLRRRETRQTTVRVPARDTADATASDEKSVRYRLRVAELDYAVDTEAAFTALFSGSRDAFWLDSAHVEPGLARFSHLGDRSGPLGESVRYRVGDGRVTIAQTGMVPRHEPGSIFDYLGRELARRQIDAPPLPSDFTCGYVGYFGYELKADCGAQPRHVAPDPDSQWIFADRALTVDHEQGRTYLLALDDGTPATERAATAWLTRAQAVVTGFVAATADARSLRRRRPAPDPTLPEPWLVRDREQYLADVEACRDELLLGESYEICLTNAVQIPQAGGGYEFYRELRRCNPAPYGAYLRFGDMHVACSSPERFLRVDRDRVVEAKPIKGTVRRGTTPQEDEQLRKELATSTKTFAENLMIVDLLRNDLGRVCEISSVHVPSLMAVESYATVHQLVSTVRGRLRTDTSVVECVRACFPGGSMTGAPKLRTMEIIDSLETQARGVYSGSIGFLGCDGTADLNIVIRTAVLSDGRWHVGAGGAIVLDSDPVEEYEEMLLKASSTLRAHPHPERVPVKEGGHLVA